MRRFERDFRNRTPRRPMRRSRLNENYQPLFEESPLKKYMNINKVKRVITEDDIKDVLHLLKSLLSTRTLNIRTERSGHIGTDLYLNNIEVGYDTFTKRLDFYTKELKELTLDFFKGLRLVCDKYCLYNFEYKLSIKRGEIVLISSDGKSDNIKSKHTIAIPLSKFY